MFEMDNLTKILKNLITLLNKVIKINFYKILFSI